MAVEQAGGGGSFTLRQPFEQRAEATLRPSRRPPVLRSRPLLWHENTTVRKEEVYSEQREGEAGGEKGDSEE